MKRYTKADGRQGGGQGLGWRLASGWVHWCRNGSALCAASDPGSYVPLGWNERMPTPPLQHTTTKSTSHSGGTIPLTMKTDDGPSSEPTTTEPTAEDTEPYSVFSPWQQNTIIGLAALGGWFSSISSFIYFPAIPFLASDIHVSVQQVNLTVTSYLIMSGIFPSIMGDAADRFGRRPVFLAALAVYFGANIGLALQSHFVLLFVLRMLQSAGISGTFSIAYGVLGDLFTPAERGGYSGIISFLYVTRQLFKRLTTLNTPFEITA